MEIRNLKTFLQVAERKSFTKAAEALNYTQSTVSTQIKQLETELGAPIFERIGNKIALTERGEILLKYAYEIIKIIEKINNNNADSDNCEGTVRFAMAPSICNIMMGRTYMIFHEKHPNISVNIIEANTDDMLHMLDHGDVDLAFVVDRHIYNKDYIVASKKKVDMRFIAGKNFSLDGQKNLSIEELVKYPFVLTEKDLSYRKLFDERLSELSLEVKPIVEIGNTYLLLELLQLGLGISFLPDYVTKQAYEEGKIVYLDVRDFNVEVWQQLLYRENKWVSPAMKRVMDYCSSVTENI